MSAVIGGKNWSISSINLFSVAKSMMLLCSLDDVFSNDQDFINFFLCRVFFNSPINKNNE